MPNLFDIYNETIKKNTEIKTNTIADINNKITSFTLSSLSNFPLIGLQKKNEAIRKYSTELYQKAFSKETIDSLEKELGEIKENEDEDEFVKRGIDIYRKMLDRQWK